MIATRHLCSSKTLTANAPRGGRTSSRGQRGSFRGLDPDPWDFNLPVFPHHLWRFLKGYAPMSHNLVLQYGECFIFSHDFTDLLLGRMECVLDGGEDSVSFICRTCFLGNGRMKQWPDKSANDYIYMPSILKQLCFYEQTVYYKNLTTKNNGNGTRQ